MTQKELENFARKLNKRISTLEKEGFTESVDYKKLKEFAKEAGATSKGYFKNRLTNFIKQGGDVKELEKKMKLASQYGTAPKTKEMKEIARRISESGVSGGYISEKTLSDIIESQKWTKGEGSLWSKLKDRHFDSEQIIDILTNYRSTDADGVEMSLMKRFEWLEIAYSGHTIDDNVAIDYLKGFITQKEMEKRFGIV